jgi:hypothetical protein
MVEPAVLLREYQNGRMTGEELLIRLCQAAADREPGRLATGLPADVLAEVRARAAAPPDSPDRCRVFHTGSLVGRGAAHTFDDESRRLYDGLWVWHRYFAAAAPGTSLE